MTFSSKATSILLAATVFGTAGCRQDGNTAEKGAAGYIFGSGTPTEAFIARDVAANPVPEGEATGVGYGAGYRLGETTKIEAQAEGIIVEGRNSKEDWPLRRLELEADGGGKLDAECTLNGGSVYAVAGQRQIRILFDEAQGTAFIAGKSLGTGAGTSLAKGTACRVSLAR